MKLVFALVTSAAAFQAAPQRSAHRELAVSATEEFKFPVFGGATGGWMRAVRPRRPP